MNTGEMERIKLLANWFDRASTALLTVGIFAPLAAVMYIQMPYAIPTLAYALGCIVWFAGAYIFHWLAVRTLRGLA